MSQSDGWDDGTVNHVASKEWNSGVSLSGATDRSIAEAVQRSYMESALVDAREALDALQAGASLWRSTESLRAAISQLEEGLKDA